MANRIIIFGMGDQSRYCEEILQMQHGAWKKIVRTLWPTDLQIDADDCGIVAIGDNWGRAKVVEGILEKYPNFKFINAIHPSCIVSPGATFGVGVLAMAGCIFNIGATMLDHTFFATGCQIEHDCKIFAFASVSAGSILGGHVVVGPYSAITLGNTVFDRVTIGSNSVIGSGSLVTKNIANNGLYYGSPAKFIRFRNEGEKFLK